MTIPIEHTRLANGLEVVLIPDRRAPVVTHMVWYRNGSADDPAGKSGIAHFLEHLMFKGTAKYPEGAFSKIVAGLGGQENAFTSLDYTAYFQRVPSEHLARMMDYEADRMRGLAFDESVVAPERDVVLEERRMTIDADPHSRLFEKIGPALHPGHPYGIPIIGWRDEIETLSRDDAFAYYRRFYEPENAILVIAGDADLDTVLRLAEETYGRIPASDRPPVRQRPAMGAPERAERITIADARVQQPIFHKIWAAPAYSTAPEQAYGLELAIAALGEGQTSRLYRRLVMEGELAASASASYRGSMRDGGAIYVTLAPHPGVSMDALEKACDDAIAGFLETGPTEAEIERARVQLVAQEVFSRDSQFALARSFGSELAIGRSVAEVLEWPERIDAVSREAALAAARAAFARPAITGLLLPAA